MYDNLIWRRSARAALMSNLVTSAITLVENSASVASVILH